MAEYPRVRSVGLNNEGRIGVTLCSWASEVDHLPSEIVTLFAALAPYVSQADRLRAAGVSDEAVSELARYQRAFDVIGTPWTDKRVRDGFPLMRDSALHALIKLFARDLAAVLKETP